LRRDTREIAQCNSAVEADHGRLKARLRPMRGLKTFRSARILAAGHALVQNLRRGHYDGGANDTTVLITFDEDNTGLGGAGRVVLLENGPSICGGCSDATPSNHYGLRDAIEQWFGLPPLYPAVPNITPSPTSSTVATG